MKELDSNNFPLVSIIIPIYNVEDFIDRGMRNILQQDYPCIEYILVDDGSTDSSALKCVEWKEKCNSIRIIHQPNSGAGPARNNGLDNAKGKYIYFFDIDDLASSNLVSYCVNIMETKDVDYILFGFRAVTTFLSNRVDEVEFEEKLFTSNEELKECYIKNFILPSHGNGFPWNKFYRKSFLDRYHLRFDNLRIQQDEVFNLKIYSYLERGYISSCMLYTYFIYDKGNTRTRFIENRFDIFITVRKCFEVLMDNWQLYDEELSDYLNNRFYNGIITCLTIDLFHPACFWGKKEKKRQLLYIRSNDYTRKALVNKKNSSLENKMYIYALKINSLYLLTIFYYIFRVLRRVKNKVFR